MLYLFALLAILTPFYRLILYGLSIPSENDASKRPSRRTLLWSILAQPGVNSHNIQFTALYSILYITPYSNIRLSYVPGIRSMGILQVTHWLIILIISPYIFSWLAISNRFTNYSHLYPQWLSPGRNIQNAILWYNVNISRSMFSPPRLAYCVDIYLDRPTPSIHLITTLIESLQLIYITVLAVYQRPIVRSYTNTQWSCSVQYSVQTGQVTQPWNGEN